MPGCGVAVPAPADPANETVEPVTRLAWDGVPLRALLEARRGVPATITDRGKAAGVGEPRALGKERTHDLICI